MAMFCHTSIILLVGQLRRRALLRLYFNSSASGQLVGWLVGWSVGRLVGQWVGWSVNWLVIWPFGWSMVGWSVYNKGSTGKEASSILLLPVY